jgi:hypothetical protein
VDCGPVWTDISGIYCTGAHTFTRTVQTHTNTHTLTRHASHPENSTQILDLGSIDSILFIIIYFRFLSRLKVQATVLFISFNMQTFDWINSIPKKLEHIEVSHTVEKSSSSTRIGASAVKSSCYSINRASGYFRRLNFPKSIIYRNFQRSTPFDSVTAAYISQCNENLIPVMPMWTVMVSTWCSIEFIWGFLHRWIFCSCSVYRQALTRSTTTMWLYLFCEYHDLIELLAISLIHSHDGLITSKICSEILS